MGALVANNSTGYFPVVGSVAPDAIRLGRFFESRSEAILGRMGYGGERHILIFGPNGSGKGTRLLVPNLLQTYGRSIFVIDPKGELAAITAQFRRRVSDVVVINPFRLFADRPGYEDLESVGYNPLAALDPASPSFNRNAAQLAEALVTVNEKDPHWDLSARALIAAIIMYVVMEARGAITPEIQRMAGVNEAASYEGARVPTMARVRELLCLASAKAAAANNFMGVGIPALALAMMKTSVAGLRNKASQFANWTEEIQSIASAARRQTEAFDDNEIALDLMKDGFRMGEMKKRPVTVYLVLEPEMMERHAKWLRLIVTAALQSVMRSREPGEQRVLFMLDEFAALGHMEIIETVWALVRGYGIQIMPVFQDVTQLQHIYKERWQTFVAQAGVVTSFAPNDMTTARWIAERAGDTQRTIVSSSSSTSSGTSWGNSQGGASSGGNSGISFSTSFQPTRVPFIQPHSLFGMRDGATLSFVAGLSDVVPGYAPSYWDIHECRIRARDNPYFISRQNVPERLDAAPAGIRLIS